MYLCAYVSLSVEQGCVAKCLPAVQLPRESGSERKRKSVFARPFGLVSGHDGGFNTTLYMHDCLPVMLWEDGFHLWELFQAIERIQKNAYLCCVLTSECSTVSAAV